MGEEVGYCTILQTQILSQLFFHHLGRGSLVQLKFVLQHWDSLWEKDVSWLGFLFYSHSKISITSRRLQNLFDQ